MKFAKSLWDKCLSFQLLMIHILQKDMHFSLKIFHQKDQFFSSKIAININRNEIITFYLKITNILVVLLIKKKLFFIGMKIKINHYAQADLNLEMISDNLSMNFILASIKKRM